MKYILKTFNWSTKELIDEQVFEHWPAREAWEIEKDWTKKCEIEQI